MILRAKTKELFAGKPLTARQSRNSQLNIAEIESKSAVLKSLPRRLVFELTNACNLNCVMCGRHAADFKLRKFNKEWFDYFTPYFNDVEEVTLMGWGEPTLHPDFEYMLRQIGKSHARTYFCTNGMRLSSLKAAIFDNNVDVFAVSVDGAKSKTNDIIRRGSDLNKIIASLGDITSTKINAGLKYPYINFVFCAMKSNISELPALVEIASDIGLEEVKVVYLTAFDKQMAAQTLWDDTKRTSDVFAKAVETGERLGVSLKLPHLPGQDPAGSMPHKDCYVAWRDFFLGSDGYVRPCMSTPAQFFKFDTNRGFADMWNDAAYREYRANVNDLENMDLPCKRCYQSSHCNWNKRRSFLQVDTDFAPEWNEK